MKKEKKKGKISLRHSSRKQVGGTINRLGREDLHKSTAPLKAYLAFLKDFRLTPMNLELSRIEQNVFYKRAVNHVLPCTIPSLQTCYIPEVIRDASANHPWRRIFVVGFFVKVHRVTGCQ